MTRYWTSWWEPSKSPKADNDIEGCIKEWVSGYRDAPTSGRIQAEVSVVALMTADDELQLRAVVESARTVKEWRFVTPKSDDWTPGDRFPMPS